MHHNQLQSRLPHDPQGHSGRTARTAVVPIILTTAPTGAGLPHLPARMSAGKLVAPMKSSAVAAVAVETEVLAATAGNELSEEVVAVGAVNP
jgi:hypothetical protein